MKATTPRIISFNKPENIVKTSDNIYRFVDHKEGLATVGFSSRQALLSYAYTFRDDQDTRKLMTKRYTEHFGACHDSSRV